MTNQYSYTKSQLSSMTPKEVMLYLAEYVPDVETVKVFNGTGVNSVLLTYKGNEFSPLIWNGSVLELLLGEDVDSLSMPISEGGARYACVTITDEHGTEALYSHEWPNDEQGWRMSVIEAVLIKHGLLGCCVEEGSDDPI